MMERPLRRRQHHVAPHDWHVIDEGDGPFLLFLHGAGGSSDSMEAMMRPLSSDFRVFAPDLPGHGKTRAGSTARFSLRAMAEDIGHLVRSQTDGVFGIIGHSAGAAIAIALDRGLSPRGQVLINPALEPFEGVSSWAFPGLAKLLSGLPFASTALSAGLANRSAVERLLLANGSDPTEEQIARYLALVETPAHVTGTLRMMAQWDLKRDLPDLARIETPTLIVCGDADPTIPPRVGRRAADRLPRGRFETRPGGHLLHEDDPATFAAAIRDFIGVIPDLQSEAR